MSQDQDIATAVLAAEQRRCAAMLANDPAALDLLLDPRLHFSHATGAVDDKVAILAKLTAGRIRYAGISWSEESVVALGQDAAVLTGRMVMDVQVEGTDKRLNNRVMSVWQRSDGDWKLLAFQSTPIMG